MKSKKKKNIGLAPGTVTYTGEKTDLEIRINYIQYHEDEYREELDQKVENVVLHPSNLNIVQWYDIRGLHNEEMIQKIADIFSMHPIAVEDAVDVNQRPVYIEYDDSAFIALKSIDFKNKKHEIVFQNVALYFGEGFVISFQEHDDDLFDKLRSRIKNQNARIRHKKSDYLAYAIIDFLVDNYFEVLEIIAAEIEILEDEINLNPEQVEKSKIYKLRKQLSRLRKRLAPLRDALLQFNRSELFFIDEKTIIFLHDVMDHTIQLIDILDNQRDILSSLQDLYISEISLKMNKVMQFLTIITAIFVPISFLAGLYGMNFKYIPELEYNYGYFILLTVMFLIVLALIINFRKKKWL